MTISLEASHETDVNRTTLVGGAQYDLWSTSNGTHHITEQATLLVSSATQIRVSEIDRDGDIVSDFVNHYDADRAIAMHLAGARFPAPDYFAFTHPPSCEDH